MVFRGHSGTLAQASILACKTAWRLVFRAGKADDPVVRLGSLSRLVASSLAAAALVALVAAASASTAKASRFVALKVVVVGEGTLHVTGGSSFTCRQANPGLRCVHVFHVPEGEQIVVNASAKARWKLGWWGGTCKGTPPTSHRCHPGRLTPGRRPTVTFVPPGDWLNPYPLGMTSPRLYNGWRVRVNSSILNADAQVEAVIDPSTGQPANPPPPAGSQYTLVDVTLTYLGPGSHRLDSHVANTMTAMAAGKGPHGYSADASCETPLLDLRSVRYINSGQTVTGDICYEIASHDAATLRMQGGYTIPTIRNGSPQQTVWFALHR
jgi:hypothetical protein